MILDENNWMHQLDSPQKRTCTGYAFEQVFKLPLCEMKFSIHPFTITKAYAGELAEKICVFKEQTKTTKAIYFTMITTFGLATNMYASLMVKNSFELAISFN